MDLTQLFCDVDDFVKQHNQVTNSRINDSRIRRPRACRLSTSEVMTICIAYHQSGYKNFKCFYLEHVKKHLLDQFPKLVSYNRFIELMQNIQVTLASYLASQFGRATGIGFIDSTPIQVCKPKRMSRNKVFKYVAAKAKSTIGWFFGFKLHLLINECGELLSVKCTPGNVDDRRPVPDMVRNSFGKLFGDKGYLSKELSDNLRQHGITLITGIKKNMKNQLLALEDKILLRKRSIIETVNDQLKNISNVEHSRHRSVGNFVVNILCGLIAYQRQPKKPTISGLHSKLLAIA